LTRFHSWLNELCAAVGCLVRPRGINPLWKDACRKSRGANICNQPSSTSVRQAHSYAVLSIGLGDSIRTTFRPRLRRQRLGLDPKGACITSREQMILDCYCCAFARRMCFCQLPSQFTPVQNSYKNITTSQRPAHPAYDDVAATLDRFSIILCGPSFCPSL